MTRRDFPLGQWADHLVGLAEAQEASGEEPPLRLASTVMLLRDGATGLEVFMLRRAASMAFAATMHVFPGGGVDARDDSEVPWAGPGPQAWADRLATDERTARMLVAAAVREIFEETGVLLAAPAGGAGQGEGVLGIAADRLAEHRRRLVSADLSFTEVLRSEDLVLRADLLTYRAHWITPVVEPRRYDTRFFAAEVPAGQDPDGDTSEADHAEWVRPADVLAAAAREEVQLMPPTLVCLEQLAEAGSVAAALAQELPVAPVMPLLVHTEAGPAMRAELP